MPKTNISHTKDEFIGGLQMNTQLFNGLLELLRGDGSIVVNKALARKIGLDASIMYSELVSKYKYWMQRNQLTEDDYFYCTVENMEEDTTLSKHKQSKAIKILVDIGLIGYDEKRKVDSLGGSVVRHFKIIADTGLILSLLSENVEVKAKKVVETIETIENNGKLKNLTFESQKSECSKVKKMNTNNTKSNNTNLNNISQEPREIDKRVELIISKTNLKPTKAEQEIIATWDIDKLEIAIEKHIEGNGGSFKYLAKCYTTASKKSNTGANKKPNKAFTNIYTHDTDLDELEKQADDYFMSDLSEEDLERAKKYMKQ